MYGVKIQALILQTHVLNFICIISTVGLIVITHGSNVKCTGLRLKKIAHVLVSSGSRHPCPHACELEHDLIQLIHF